MQLAEVTFVLTGPDPFLFPAWRDLNMNLHKVINLRDGTEDHDAVNLYQLKQVPKGDKGEKGDPGGSIDFDAIVDGLADFNIDLTQQAPADINGISADPGIRFLLIKQSAILPNPPGPPAGWLNGIYVVGDDLMLTRDVDFYTGDFIVGTPGVQGYRVFISASQGGAEDAAFQNTVWEMVQLNGIIVDAQANTWNGPLQTNSPTVPAGVVFGGSANPKAPFRPYDDVRLTPNHIGRFKGGRDGKQRVSPWWMHRRLNFLSNYFRHDLAWNGGEALLAALSEPMIDEVIIDTHELYFGAPCVLPATLHDKRIICDPGKTHEGHVTIRVNQGVATPGGLKFQGSRWDIIGHMHVATIDQYTGTSVNAAGVQFDDGVTDITFRDGLTCEGFAYGIYFVNSASRIKVNGWGSFSPGIAGVSMNSTTSAYLTDIQFSDIRSDAALTVIAGTEPPYHFRFGRHTGSSTELGVALRRGKMTGGRTGILLNQPNSPPAAGTDDPDGPRNFFFQDLIVSSTERDALLFDAGAKVVMSGVHALSAGRHGLNISTTFQGQIKAGGCEFLSSQQHGINDAAQYAISKVFEGCVTSANGQAASNTYDGYSAVSGVYNVRLIGHTSGPLVSNLAAAVSAGSQRYGIRNVVSGSNGNLIAGEDVRGNATAGIG